MSRLLLTLFILCTVPQSYGAALPVPKAPELAARSYLLADFQSGRILVEKNIDVRIEPASITKIMTAYVVFRELEEGNLGLHDQVLVSKKAWKTPGSRMFIEVNKRVSVPAYAARSTVACPS